MEQVTDSGWYLFGEVTRRFESDYAHYIGTRHCVGVANGLDALTLMLRGYMELGQLREDDEVIVPANTYIATILAISECRLRPVLVEPRIDTLQIDDTLIEQAITPRTRAIMIVHLYGRCAYTDRVGDICRKHHLLLFEDNAQAHGCECPAQSIGTLATMGMQEHPIHNVQCSKTGSLGHAAAHSFYPGKNLGAFGDAGAVTTDDKELADVVRVLANYGSSRKYVFPFRGRNSRLDELQAAVLNVKLKYLDADNARRREIAQRYYNYVHNPLITLPSQGEDCGSHVYHIFPVLCSCRDALQRYLAECGVHTVIHYPIPPHRQQCYPEFSHLSLPVTELIHEQELSIPCNQTMTEVEVEYIIDLLNRFNPSAKSL
jgi:dTDP-4-amino-4,6-dideoxygalactose transaminase